MNSLTKPISLADAAAAPIGALLRARGALSEADLNRGLLVQREIGGLLGQVLQRIGAITEEALLDCLSAQLSLDVVSLQDLPAAQGAYLDAARRLGVSSQWLAVRRVAVWNADGKAGDMSETIAVLAEDPVAPALRELIDRAAHAAGQVAVIYFLAHNQTIDAAISAFRAAPAAIDDDAGDAARLRELAEEAPIIDYVNAMFARAIRENASDIHIEAGNPRSVVRYRIDGVLQERAQIGQAQFEAVASRIKLISGMDIAERRMPQDGRNTARFAGHEIDLRVSSVPSTWGESVVIRLLRKQTELPDLAGLGLDGRTGDILRRVLSQPNGVFLVTGPTGSGKSTTLYRGLETINDGKRKIITIEDPVEYDVAGVTQIQVKSEIGFDFARGLRSILRQDPDVIMVGEIRDRETATIAAQASMTGHLVLSTLHTNSALAAVTRLRNIGLEPYLVAASVRGLMAQRLVRKLCLHCAQPTNEPAGEALSGRGPAIDTRFLPQQGRQASWRRARGCPSCADTGYRGRLALSEIVEIDDGLREAISQEASIPVLLELSRKQGFLTLFEDGYLKAERGLTSFDEVLRVCSGDYV
ncbi:MAG: ATPase, T2SS/T4P/T4SS family [Parvularculaceae bacterium]|nr:ATPase, T2SS/T4P/T4SS family [Parvularculaceae bacterium]